jgi:hypothetical protein
VGALEFEVDDLLGRHADVVDNVAPRRAAAMTSNRDEFTFVLSFD